MVSREVSPGRFCDSPLSLFFDGNAYRLSPTLALGWTPDEILDARVTTICDDKLDIPTGQRRSALGQLAPDRILATGARFGDIVGNLLKTPPAGQWQPLTPNLHRGQLEILLGPGNFLGSGPGNPGLLWSEPADVRGPHSQDIADTFNVNNPAVLNGETSSDGQFTWAVTKFDAGGAVTKVTAGIKSVQFSRFGTDELSFAIASQAMDTADEYCQATLAVMNADNSGYVIVRQAGSTFTAGTKFGTSGYGFVPTTFGNNYYLFDLPNDAILAGPIAIGGAPAVPKIMRVEISGTSLLGIYDGSTVISVSDSAYSGSAGNRKTGLGSYSGTNNANVTEFDDFRAADLAAPAQSQAPRTMHQARLRR